ncbi:MAG: hypothetical protein U0871_22005 [Gemmataceae bacterium]
MLTTPVLAFNLQYDFAPLRFQWEHAMASDTGPGLRTLGEFVGIQTLLFGTLPFVVFAWAVRNWRGLAADPRLRACACLFVVPFGFFLYKACRGPMEGNWAACYVGLWPVAAVWFERVRDRRWGPGFTVATFAAPAACVVLLSVHLVAPLPFLSPANDRLHRLAPPAGDRPAGGRPGEGGRAAGVHPDLPVDRPAPVLRGGRPADGRGQPAEPLHPPAGPPPGRGRAYVLNESLLPPELADGFGPPDVTGLYPLYVRGELHGGLLLLKYTQTGPCRTKGLAAGVAGIGWGRVP